ncbi:MAG: DHH family phosphoesterase [Paracholeplasma sp.]|nr:DHH family phosphoesterase [Paracholeplasma sp.]MDY3196700.1 DHH family phosphoesterase [Paracholeplasma sp.]
MLKLIKKIRIQTFFSVLFQFVALIALGIIYVTDIFELRQYLNLTVFVFITLGIAILNTIYLWIQTARVSKKRAKSDLDTLEIVGSDVKEAYNFAMLGLIVVDQDFNIIWISELFRDRNIDILDKNIIQWRPELKKLVEISEAVESNIEDTLKLEIDSRNYEVKFVNDAGLFMFRDTTEFEYLFDQSNKQAPVVGIVMIDNFSDMVKNREISNPMIAIITSSIFDYSRKYGILVRQYRDDSFIMIMTQESFGRIYDDKFSLIETIRNKEENKEMRMTLSMAFAHNFPDFMRLGDMAVNAIDTAIARGGDQVVISKYGEENEYLGGATAASEKRNKTAIRMHTDTLFSYIREASNVLIMGHTNTDLDALGASLGLKSLADYAKSNTKTKANKDFVKARIVYHPQLTEAKTRDAVTNSFTRQEEGKIFISPQELASEKGENSLVNSNTLLIICDVSRPSMVIDPKLLDRVDKVFIIDHHRRTDEFIENPLFDYTDTTASSTCEMIAEMIYYGNTPEYTLESKYATLMLAGIYLDTNYFRNPTTGARTFLASMILEEYGADVTLADEFLKDEFEEYAMITKIMNSVQTISLGVTLAKADPNDIVDIATLAKVANQSMRIKGVNASFVVGLISPKEVKISSRSDGSINVQFLLEKIGGGGHQSNAAAVVKNKTIDEVETMLKEVISQYLNDARAVKKNI